MKTKRRFKSEQELLKAISEAHAKADAKLSMADELDKEAKRLSLLDAPAYEYSMKIFELKRKARRLRTGARNLIEKKCAKLGKALAKMRTGILPGIGIDNSEVVEL